MSIEDVKSEMRKMTLGEFELFALSDGFFRLDGGAMFGVVPKPLWEKRIPADDRNRIRLGLRPLLVKTPNGLILIDTGIGDKYGPKEMDIYAIEHPPSLFESLEAAEAAPADVRFVVNTHLHFDHAGGNTIRDEKGEAVPAFENARYVIQEREWAAAVRPGERSAVSYRPENYLPLEAAGLLERVDGEVEIVPGVVLTPTAGHTGGHQSVRIVSMGQTAFYLGDAVPTASHLALPWVMGYDLFPQETVDRKRELLELAAGGGWLLVFEHEPEFPWGRVEKRDGNFKARPV